MKFTFYILLSIISLNNAAQSSYYVLFEYNKAQVPDTAMAALIKTIYTNNVSSIYLEGHCDSVGSKRYNYGLSKRRVEAVKSLLVDNGFDVNKINGKLGFGKDRPLNNNETDQDRQLNRRVLVKFIIGDKRPDPAEKEKSSEKKKYYSSKKNEPNPTKKNSRPKEKRKSFTAKNFTKNSLIRIPNLLFPGGRHKFYPKSLPILDSLYRIMKDNPNLIVEIQGHVCCTTYHLDGFDRDTFTDNLSENRARAVYSYLINRGISYKRMTVKGYGGSRKINEDESSEELRSVNRRVDVLVIEN